MINCLKRITQVGTSLSDAWDFFSRPKNLAVITPPELNLIPSSESADEMYEGQIITYRVRPFLGLPLLWVAEITHVRPPHYFVDEQRQGPFALWHHEHFFRQVENEVFIEDVIHYSIFGGPLGILVDSLLVQSRLKHIFDFREKKVSELFSNPRR